MLWYVEEAECTERKSLASNTWTKLFLERQCSWNVAATVDYHVSNIVFFNLKALNNLTLCDLFEDRVM